MNTTLIIVLYIIVQAIIIFGVLFWVLPDVGKNVVENKVFQQTSIFKGLIKFVDWLNTKLT